MGPTLSRTSCENNIFSLENNIFPRSCFSNHTRRGSRCFLERNMAPARWTPMTVGANVLSNTLQTLHSHPIWCASLLSINGRRRALAPCLFFASRKIGERMTNSARSHRGKHGEEKFCLTIISAAAHKNRSYASTTSEPADPIPGTTLRRLAHKRTHTP